MASEEEFSEVTTMKTHTNYSRATKTHGGTWSQNKVALRTPVISELLLNLINLH